MRPFRLTSLRTKLVVTLVPLAVLTVAAMTWLAVTKMTGAQRDGAYAEMRETAAANANRFDATLEQKVALAKTLATTMEAYQGQDPVEVSGMVKRLAERNPDTVGVYVGFEPDAFDGNDAAHQGRPYQVKGGGFGPYWNRIGGKLRLEPLIDPYTSEYYTLPQRNGRFTVIEPFLYDGALMSSYIAPIRRDGRFVGIAGTDITLDTLDRAVRAIHVLDSGYALLVSKGGTFVSAPERRLIGRQTLGKLGETRHDPTLQAVAKAVSRGERGQVEAVDPWTGKDAVLSYAPVRAGGWSLITIAPKDEVLAAAHSLRWQLLLAGLIGILVITAAIVLVAGRITRPLQAFVARLKMLSDTAVASLREGIDALARGDLTVEARGEVETLEIRGHDEIADASRTANELIERTTASVDAYNASRGSLGELIGRVTTSATAVAASSQQMASTSEETGRAVGEIAGAIGEVAAGAERQVRVVGDARVAADRTSEAAEHARTIAEDGTAASDRATEAMAQVRDASAQVSDAIGSLAEKSVEIGAIVGTITGIAEQTNLLALNAAIEAARAGEQGRGFAVVAEEVRKLAEESRQAAGTIESLLSQIQAETNTAVAIVDDGARLSREGAEVVAEARDAFARIGDAVRDVSARIGDIATATAEVVAVAEQASASTEQVSASTEQTSASTQQIAASAQELARTAEELDGLVRRFTIAK